MIIFHCAIVTFSCFSSLALRTLPRVTSLIFPRLKYHNIAKMASTASVNLVTLDNLTEVWPRWDPSDSNHLYALVDMGR